LWKSQIKEGDTYVMQNFKVLANDFSPKACLHPFKLSFVGGEGGSKLKPIVIEDIPHYKLTFKPFEEILSGNYHSDLLVGIDMFLTFFCILHLLTYSIFLRLCSFLCLVIYRHYWSSA
jgi:hypothetical protein